MEFYNERYSREAKPFREVKGDASRFLAGIWYTGQLALLSTKWFSLVDLMLWWRKARAVSRQPYFFSHLYNLIPDFTHLASVDMLT